MLAAAKQEDERQTENVSAELCKKEVAPGMVQERDVGSCEGAASSSSCCSLALLHKRNATGNSSGNSNCSNTIRSNTNSSNSNCSNSSSNSNSSSSSSSRTLGEDTTDDCTAWSRSLGICGNACQVSVAAYGDILDSVPPVAQSSHRDHHMEIRRPLEFEDFSGDLELSSSVSQWSDGSGGEEEEEAMMPQNGAESSAMILFQETDLQATTEVEKIRRVCYAKVPEWNRYPLGRICVRPLLSGLTNQLYHCSLRRRGTYVSKKRHSSLERSAAAKQVDLRLDKSTAAGCPSQVLLRVYGTDVSRFYDSKFELQVFKWLGRFQIAPKLIADFEGGRVEEWLDGSPLKVEELQNPAVLCSLATILSNFHKLSDLMDVALHGCNTASRQSVLMERIRAWRDLAAEQMALSPVGVLAKEGFRRCCKCDGNRRLESAVTPTLEYCHDGLCYDVFVRMCGEADLLERMLISGGRYDSNRNNTSIPAASAALPHPRESPNDAPFYLSSASTGDEAVTTTAEYAGSSSSQVSIGSTPRDRRLSGRSHSMNTNERARHEHKHEQKLDQSALGSDDADQDSAAGRRIAMEVVFCHNDIQENNILKRGCTLRLIDFEYSNFNYRGFDLANFFAESCLDNTYTEYPFFRAVHEWYLSSELRYLFCAVYLSELFNTPILPSNYAVLQPFVEQIERLVLATHLFWGFWAIVRASTAPCGKDSFDFFQYASARFREFELKKKELKALGLIASVP